MSRSINKKLLISGISRKILGVNKSIREISKRQLVIHPEEISRSAPAIYRSEHLDRISAVMEDTSIENEMRRIKGGKIIHGATVAYTLEDVEIINGYLYGGGTGHRLAHCAKRLIIDSDYETHAEATLACSYYGNIYFGHWMRDDLTLHLAAEFIGSPIGVERKRYGHEAAYCELFGLAQKKVSRARFRKLVVLEDYGQNTYKRQRYEALRARLPASAAANKRVFIRRGTNAARASRSLINAPEIEQFLSSQGFRIVDPDRMSSFEIVEAIRGAKIVMGVEGSHLAHMIYTIADDGAMLVLQPPYRFNNVYKDYADCLGLRYGFAVGEESEGGFSISLDDIKWLLNKVPC